MDRLLPRWPPTARRDRDGERRDRHLDGPDERFAAAAKIVENAEKHGIAREDVIIDSLAMPNGAAPDAGTAMIRTMQRIRDELGVTCLRRLEHLLRDARRHGIDAIHLRRKTGG